MSAARAAPLPAASRRTQPLSAGAEDRRRRIAPARRDMSEERASARSVLLRVKQWRDRWLPSHALSPCRHKAQSTTPVAAAPARTHAPTPCWCPCSGGHQGLTARAAEAEESQSQKSDSVPQARRRAQKRSSNARGPHEPCVRRARLTHIGRKPPSPARSGLDFRIAETPLVTCAANGRVSGSHACNAAHA